MIIQNRNLFLLSLILVVFFLKGVFLTAIFPIFKGQDESRHYNSIQFLNEPKEKTWEKTKKSRNDREKQDLSTYNYSEEIQKTASLTEISAVRSPQNYEKINFTDSFLGENEAEINAKSWDRLNKTYPPDIVQGSLYHKLGAVIEKSLANENIFVRYFSLRIFSLLLGTLAVFVFYLIAKNIGFSGKQSLLLTAILAFQPRFSLYLTNINYDALLILSFFLFTLAGVLALKNGFNWKNISLLSSSLLLALFTKGTGIVLLPVLIGLAIFQLHQKITNKKTLFLLVLGLTFAIFFTLNFRYNFSNLISLNAGGSSAETISSLGKYLADTFLQIPSPNGGFWGDINWVRGNYSPYLINIIWLAEIAGVVGLILFFRKKDKIDFLPEKKYLVFLFGVWLALQLGIRFFDWKYSLSDPDLPLGTPGRYFLPTLPSHLLLIFTGIGYLLKNKSKLDIALKTGLVLMFILFMHLFLNSVIPRFYL